MFNKITRRAVSLTLTLVIALSGAAVAPTTASAATEPIVSAIAVGSSHTLAVKNDGSLWTWGEGVRGDTGVDKQETRLNPAKLMDGVTIAAADVTATFVVNSDGSLWAWGWSVIKVGEHFDTPTKISDDVSSVSTSDYCTFFIKKDGSLWGWGLNSLGQLGDGTSVDRETPVNIMDGVVSVATSGTHTLAVKTDGTLWAWGSNKDGELGLENLKTKTAESDGETAEYCDTPQKVMDNVVAVAAGVQYRNSSAAFHGSISGGSSFALKKDGDLWAWGANEFGQLGDGTTAYHKTPVKVMDNVVSVAAGSPLHYPGEIGGYMLAVKKDGGLYACGFNSSGELGDGTTTERHTPVKVMGDVKNAFAGAAISYAIKADNSVWAWGQNLSGQFGNGTQGDGSTTPIRVMEGGTSQSAPSSWAVASVEKVISSTTVTRL